MRSLTSMRLGEKSLGAHFPQLRVAVVGDSLLPTASIVIPRGMPVPRASRSGPCGSRDSAGSSSRTECHVVHSDGGDDAVNEETQWFTTARQLAEGFVMFEGDERLRKLVKGVGKHPKVSLSSMSLCAAALCRSSGTFIEVGQTLGRRLL